MRVPLIRLMLAASAIALAPLDARPSVPIIDDVTHSVRAPTKFRYFAGTPAVHPARRLRWYYNPVNEPPALAGRMASILRSAAATWSRRCAIQFEYAGVTTQAAGSYDLDNVFGWASTSAGSLALTYVRSENWKKIDDADIVFNPSFVQTESSAYTAAVHEIGHALGLAHSNREGAVMSGPPSSRYTYRGEPTLDDFEGCQALYNNAYCATAKPADEYRTEPGRCPAGMEGGVRYRRSYYCANGAWAANAWEKESLSCSTRAATRPAATGTLREYVREATGEYFITASRTEQQALESGALPGWTKTGAAWPVWESSTPDLASVCRFYGDTSVDASTGKRKGPDSHFYTADAAECRRVPEAFPVWRLETASAFHVAVPKSGQCAEGTRPVTRFFRPYGEPAHRYVSDGALAATMLALDWVAEGTVFCLPQ